MNLVVVPLSAPQFPRRFTFPLVAPAVLAHMILVGPPIAVAISWSLSPGTILIGMERRDRGASGPGLLRQLLHFPFGDPA